VTGPRAAELVLTEGRYHQVRRMFSSQGCEVLALHRRSFGPLETNDLAPGAWRELPLDFFDRPHTGISTPEPAPRV
jgi:16S rRNA pseudouridine516 synthase